MPLSKARDRQRKREERARLGWTQVGQHNPSTEDVQPKSVIPKLVADETTTVIPKLPWYAGASNHFGVVRNRRYAKEFLISLGL